MLWAHSSAWCGKFSSLKILFPLLWCHPFPFLEGADQVAAVGKAGFLTDVGQILIGKQEQVGRLIDPCKFNIFLAGLVVGFPEELGKIRIAHATHLCQLMHPQGFAAMLLDIFGHRVDRSVAVIRCRNDRVGIYALFLQAAHQVGQQRSNIGADQDIVAVRMFPLFLQAVSQKLQNGKLLKLLSAEMDIIRVLLVSDPEQLGEAGPVLIGDI